MKYCPSCQTTYTDDSLRFCLDDGNSLLVYSSENSQTQTLAFDETETVVRQNRMPLDWEQSQVTRLAALQPEVKKSNAHLIAALTALMMCVIFGGAAVVWLLMNSGSSDEKVLSNLHNNPNNTTVLPSPMPTSGINSFENINERKQKGKTNSGINDTGWEPINYQASLNGTNLTYYRGTTVESCKSDCANNPKCRAFILIRAGAYNPNDPPMCYLASEVTGVVSHSCCISAIKDEGGESRTNSVYGAEVRKACGYSLGSGLYEKWKQMGGEHGILGCPTMDEIEAENSPQGTTGRMTHFGKGDGGYIIRHGSGRFSGTSFEVSGCMCKIFASIGGTKSWLGFPLQDGFTTSTGARQNFEGGYILWDSKTYNCQVYKN